MPLWSQIFGIHGTPVWRHRWFWKHECNGGQEGFQDMQHLSVACGRYILGYKDRNRNTYAYGLVFEREKVKNGGGRDTASNRIRTAHSSRWNPADLSISENIMQTFHFHKMDGYSM